MKFPHETEEALEMIRGLLRYDPETGKLYWNARRRKVRLGMEAGNKKPSGYIVVGINRRHWKAHRVCYALYHGHWPISFLDHRNGDPADNRISNLREASRAQNNRNKAAFGKKGLPKGVSVNGKNFAARIFAGKQIHLGTYPTPEAAHTAYVAAAKEHFGAFARAA